MSVIVNFIQILSAIVTILSGIGWGFGVPKAFENYGVEITHLQIAFAISLFMAIVTTYQKNKNSRNGRDKKTQVQIGGRGNRQEMK